jgi:predicted negative regulator of RcsB-dependent stress response
LNSCLRGNDNRKVIGYFRTVLQEPHTFIQKKDWTVAEYLNEQEQYDALKAFWKTYGSWIVLGILLVIFAMVGTHYWQARNQSKLDNASIAYQNILSTLATNHNADITASAEAMMKQDGHTPYASMAALLLAGQQVNANQLSAATENLQWVIKHAPTPALKAIATLRVARILLAEKQPQQALALLVKPLTGFDGAYAMVAGDAYVQLQDYAKAYQSYQLALHNMPENDYFVGIIKLKLSNLPVTASGNNNANGSH